MEQSVGSDIIEIKPKMHYTGKVVKIALAGAAIDLGNGQKGLLHIAQMVAPAEQPIKRVEDVLSEGQEIEVWIKKVVKKDGEERIELTMIKPLDLDWKDIKTGMSVKGSVVRLEKFGAFVEIGAERPGLVHISEMAHGYVRAPGDVVKEGDEIEAQVIDFNRKKKQIKLSMKALQPEPEKIEEPALRFSPQTPTEKRDKPVRRKKSPRKGYDEVTGEELGVLLGKVNEPVVEAEPTAMEIAMRAAMENAKLRKKQLDEKKKAKAVSTEQEDILSRTLTNKVQSV